MLAMNADIATDFGSHNLQNFITLFTLKHLKLKLPDKFGQGWLSVSTVSDIAKAITNY